MDIIMKDWTGRVLFQGPVDSKQVDVVLDMNRCKADHNNESDGDFYCPHCSDSASGEPTGYSGDFSVEWEDSSRSDNVYEFINY